MTSDKEQSAQDGITDEGSGKIMFLHWLQLAADVLKKARRKESSASRQHQETELGEILQVYILSAASLEAFINEVCWDKLDELKASGSEADWQTRIKAMVDQRKPIIEKWRSVPRLLWGRTFDEEANPWRDFVVLVRLRNSLLHYRMELLPSGQIPKFLEAIRDLLSPDLRIGAQRMTLMMRMQESEHWIDRICTLEMGTWAHNTAIEMIHEFLRFSDEKTREDYTWLLQGFGVKRVRQSKYRGDLSDV